MTEVALVEITAERIAELRKLVGEAHVRTGESVLELDPGWSPHNLDAGVVVSPGSTAEIAAVLRWCTEHGVAVVPHGGRTGLVGGAFSHQGEIVMSLLRLNDIEPIVADMPGSAKSSKSAVRAARSTARLPTSTDAVG